MSTQAGANGAIGGRVQGRFKALLVLAVVLLVLGLTGVLQAGRGVEIERDEAVEIARSELNFDAETEDARLVRQGFVLRPVWAVAFAVRTPGGDRTDYDQLMVVEVDATDGSILNVNNESG